MFGAIALTLLAATPPQDRVPLPPPVASPTDGTQVALDRAALGRMTVKVGIGTDGPYNFVIDTGAERSVVSRELATALALEPARPVRLFGFGGVATVDTVRVPALSISTLPPTALDAPALHQANLGAQGMLGIDALQGHRVSLEFARRRMTLVPARRRGHGTIVARAQSYRGQLIVTDAFYYGQRISVVVDTGSAITVGNLAMRGLARRAPRPIGPISVVSVTGQSFGASYVATDKLKIGGVGFDNVAMAFADAPPFGRFGLSQTPALIMGIDMLKLFRRVEIDFANREILFTLPAPRLRFGACTAMLNCASL